MFVNTKTAARILGLSQYELRRGYKQGVYPAIQIGGGDERKTLRWDVNLMRDTLVSLATHGKHNIADGGNEK